MARYRITLTYDGTNYGGWQIQPNALSIQEALQKKLSILCNVPIVISGSGRTDAGVHALGQEAHFDIDPPLEDTALICYKLNCMLPRDIRILSLQEVAKDFHARYSAVSKEYHYHLHLDRIINPFTRLYSWHVPLKNVDLELLSLGASRFVGTKNFTGFANEAHKGAAAKDGIRSIKRLELVKEPGGIRLEFEADGFLYKMVRNITGSLIDLCAGLLTLEDIDNLFVCHDRKQAGRTAPPHGLFLVKVQYE